MLIKFIITQNDRLEIETFDVDIERNRIYKLNSANRNFYLRHLNDFILRDICNETIISE